MAHKVWFITGASRGFGKIWAEAALQRGDLVAATARNPQDLAPLVSAHGKTFLPLALDVTQRQSVFDAVQRAHAHFGRLDVLINNAGYGQFGAIEELSEDAVRSQFETNVFGALWVLQAALPLMRAQGSGHLLSVSSIGGITAFPNIGIYHASKWALEAINQSLAQEVAPFGLKVTLIEPAGYATDWSGSSAKHATPLAEYGNMRELAAKRRTAVKPGNPQATANAILQLVDAENPPLRFFLGSVCLPIAKRDYEKRLAEWQAWNAISAAAE